MLCTLWFILVMIMLTSGGMAACRSYLDLLECAADTPDPVERLRYLVAFVVGGLRQQASLHGVAWHRRLCRGSHLSCNLRRTTDVVQVAVAPPLCCCPV